MKLLRAIVIVANCGLAGCVSYAPAVLVPEITLSPEQVTLHNTGSAADARLDFGLDVSRNESDSLFNVEVLPGVVVRQVVPGGPAAAAGIQVGDVILRVDNLAINQPDALLALQRSGEGNQFRFTVRRGTTAFEATVIARQVLENPAPIELYRIDPLATRAGFTTTLVDIASRGSVAAAEVTEFFPESPLPGAGINVGDLILALDGSYLNSAQDLVTRLNRDHELGSEVSLTVYRDQSLDQVDVSLWDPGRRISRISLWPLVRYESALSPESRSFSLIDLWLFSVYSFRQVGEERSHSVLGLINFSSDVGELVEE